METTQTLNPALMAVIANRMDAILREMTNTLLRSGRSAVLSTARDFSCSLVTADNRLLSTAEGLPVHIFGSHLQTETMSRLHDDIAPGDAFLHNDPYSGNTHAADHTILVPVFAGGKHMFTAVAKAHQADIGNSFPTTYMSMAKDVYEEGALIFPATRVQRDYKDIGDIIRMCRMRIRVPDQWYGDYLACLGSARIGERRITQLIDKYGVQLIEQFIEEWLDYSERRMEHALRSLTSGVYEGSSTHDALPGLSNEEIPIKVTVDVSAEKGQVTIDLRDNPDCIDAGINLSRATSVNSAVTGLFNVLDPDLPHNHGSLRRVNVQIRENCIAGYPVHPQCCSMSTTNIADRVVNATQMALAEVAKVGLAEGGASMGPAAAVVAGLDPRRGGGEPFINQIIIGVNGGPASANCDGWVTYMLPVTGGLLMRDSVEVDEQKYPISFDSLELVTDSGGAGTYRGGPSFRTAYSPRFHPMTVAAMADSGSNPAKGTAGGLSGRPSSSSLIDKTTGEEEALPGFGQFQIDPNSILVGIDAGGGGFGDPAKRNPEAVLEDVLEGWVSVKNATETYRVALRQVDPPTLFEIDEERTRELRSQT